MFRGWPPSDSEVASMLATRFPSLAVSVVSPPTMQQSPLSASLPGTSQPPQEDISSLAEMFPLLTESTIRSGLLQCGGNLSSALDMLLTKDLVDREREELLDTTTTSQRPLCGLWLRGECKGGRAAACRARHFYLDSDSRGRSRARAGTALQRFSSPYRARLVTEQVQVQREAVNLESGQSQRWLELQEREIVDLTGRNDDVVNLSSGVESDEEHDEDKKLESSIDSKFEIMNKVEVICDSKVCDTSTDAVDASASHQAGVIVDSQPQNIRIDVGVTMGDVVDGTSNERNIGDQALVVIKRLRTAKLINYNQRNEN